MAYVECVVNTDYEILNKYPFTIRKKSNKREVRESLTGSGYPRVHLNLIDYLKHRIVAEQFIPNPDNLPEVDHINHDKTDYHLSNLRWCNKSQNQRNKRTCRNIELKYIEYDDLPDDLIMVDFYGKHKIKDYYYSIEKDKFYFDTEFNCRELKPSFNKNGKPFVSFVDINGERFTLHYSKFKREHNIDF